MDNILINRVAKYLGFKESVVIHSAYNAQESYKQYYIPKKKGGRREIFHPSKLTKSLQYACIETILSELPVHDCAAAYRRGIPSPLLVNAKKHSEYPYSVKIDFTDFFPSIKPPDLINLVKSIDKFKNITKEDESFLTNALFVRMNGWDICLAIGAPSSPIISNAVMYSLDEKLARLSFSISSKSVYSRYADDIVFSTSKKGGCAEFFTGCNEIIAKTNAPKLFINSKKTFFASCRGRRVVTGLFICPDKSVSIGRKNKRKIRSFLFDLKNNKLSEDKKKYLSGYLSFILDVEPDLYNRLAIKYGAKLVKDAHKLQPPPPSPTF